MKNLFFVPFAFEENENTGVNVKTIGSVSKKCIYKLATE